MNHSPYFDLGRSNQSNWYWIFQRKNFPSSIIFKFLAWQWFQGNSCISIGQNSEQFLSIPHCEHNRIIYSIYIVRGFINRARWLKVIWLSRSHPLKWFSHCNIDESFDRKLILHSILYSLLSPFLKNIRRPKYQRGLQK